MDINLKNKTFVVAGLKNTGKTFLVQNAILNSIPNNAVYDITGEYKNCKSAKYVYASSNKQYSQEMISEVDNFIEKLVNAKKPELVIFEEADCVLPNMRITSSSLLHLNSTCRHFDKERGISVGFITRRLPDLNSKIVEIADYIFIFQLSGKNDLIYLEQLKKGLSEQMAQIEQNHKFIVLDGARNFAVYDAI